MSFRKQSAPSTAIAAVAGLLGLAATGPADGQCMTWTLDADFDEGTLINVNHDAPNSDQLQLNEQPTPFPFINVAASARGTIVRINVDTGEIIGEYLSSPEGRARNPSRTTVDAFGNVWAGNRDEAEGGMGSVVKVGLVIGGTRVDELGNPDPTGQYLAPPYDYNTCVDRDGDGLIKTSMGLGNILPWPDNGDGAGGPTGLVEDAEDECILIFQRVEGDFIRHVSVDASNNVWTAGNFGADNAFELLDGDNGAILAGFDVGAGGYGGLVDGNGVIWSSGRGPGLFTVLWYDTNNTIPTGDDSWQYLDAPNPYGLGIDGNGHVWNAQWSDNQIREFAPGGALLNVYPTFGASDDRGVAVTPIDDNVWIANSGGSDVSRLAPDGSLVKVIPLGADGFTPTGVAVDANGKVWATCLSSDTAKRIDPNGGGDGLGAVDLTVDLGPGAGPYNYSDMTGVVLLEAIQQGTWTVVWDSGAPGITGCTVSWNSEPQGAEPPGTFISVEVRAADSIADLPGQTFVMVGNGVPIIGLAGRYWEIQATLGRDPGLEITPVLSDLFIDCNEAPTIACPDPVTAECSSPDGTEVTLTVMVEDVDGDDLVIAWEVDGGVVQVDNVAGGGPAEVTLTLTYALGLHPVTITVDDGQADPVSCDTSVTVVDTTPPVITVGEMALMWPPNHKYHTFSLSDCVVSVDDGCQGPLDIETVGTIVSIYSDEPEDVGGGGDGNTLDDIVILGPTTFKLRSEREGGGNGRVYGITFEATDDAGNVATATCYVGVPHDQSGDPPVNDGPGAGYTVPAAQPPAAQNREWLNAGKG
jgi:streptogramin lyase